MNQLAKISLTTLLITIGTCQNANAQYSEYCEEAVTLGTVAALGVMGWLSGGSGWYAAAYSLGSHLAVQEISQYTGGPCQAADLPEALEGYFNVYAPHPHGIPTEELEFSASIAQDLMLCGCSMETVLGAYFMVDSEREEYLRGIGERNGATAFQPIYYPRPSLSFQPLNVFHDGFDSHSSGSGGGSDYVY